MVVVGEAEGIQHVPEIYRQRGADVVLLETSVPGPSGLRLVGKLVRDLPQAPVLVLAINENLGFVRSILAIGVQGYVLKRASESEFLQAVRAVARGRRFLDSRLSDALAGLILDASASSARPALSQRERQVLTAIAKGFTRQEIADELRVSVKTVETYRARIRKKLELHSRAELVQYALASGILDNDEAQLS
jgi:DNA-binding NarL/FixJ family response regulator